MRRAEDLYKTYAREVPSAENAVVAVYDQLVQSVLIAQRAIQAGRLEEAHRNLVASQDVLSALAEGQAQDRQFAGADNLVSLLLYCRQELMEANVQKDVQRLAPVLSVLTTLRDAFLEASQRLYGGDGQ
ncbi:MAG: flagellar protein FliS [Thermaerobacter sp.]|nr:flagellar protein FliS [Thermaerobacter sp.]